MCFYLLFFKAGAEWRINSVWHSITVIPDCHRFIVFLPKKSTIGSKNPIMGILEENRTFISSRPEGWLKLDCISGDFEDFSMYKIK